MTAGFGYRAHDVAARHARVAIIDIGSNTVRLVVYDGLTRTPITIFNEKMLCGLGRGVTAGSPLNPEGVRTAAEALARFVALAGAMDVARLYVLATAAVRDAADGLAFAAEMERRFEIEVRVLSGAEEARYSAMGVLCGIPGADGLVGDLGGGSLELVALNRGELGGPRDTLPLGPLRLAEDSDGKRPSAERLIEAGFGGLPWLEEAKGRPFYPVGGAWRALAQMHISLAGYPLHVVHHYRVETAEAAAFLDTVLAMSRKDLETIPLVPRRRLDALPYAALVMRKILDRVRPSELIFSANGLREGFFYSRLPASIRHEDPLLSACVDFAERMGRFHVHGEELLEWTTPLFPKESPESRRLRMAACLLSDVAWSDHPDYRGDQALLRILRMPFIGLTHPDRVFLALMVAARYDGHIDQPSAATVKGLIPPERRDLALLIGLALRLAQTVSGGAPGLLLQTRLSLKARQLVLTLPEDDTPFGGEVVQRRFARLARALDRKPVVSRSDGQVQVVGG